MLKSKMLSLEFTDIVTPSHVVLDVEISGGFQLKFIEASWKALGDEDCFLAVIIYDLTILLFPLELWWTLSYALVPSPAFATVHSLSRPEIKKNWSEKKKSLIILVVFSTQK